MHNKIEGQESSFDVWKNASADDTWSSIVVRGLVAAGGTASLAELYKLIEPHPRTRERKFWKAKVRQVLERSAVFVRISAGLWSFSSEHTTEQLADFARLRRERYARKSEARS